MGAFDTKTVAPFSNPAQIGDTQFHPESGTLINKPNGEGFVRSGTLALTSLYPQCAGVEHIMAHGATAVTLPTSVKISGYATNGSGTAVATYGDNANVLVTTNSGASWAIVAHGLTHSGAGTSPATDVVWNGTQFIVVGNSATQIQCSYSIAAAVFTLGGSSTVTTATATTARIVYDGTTCLAVCGGTSSVQAATTPTGVTLTARTLSQNIPVPVLTSLASLAASRWYISDSSTAVASQSTAADASTWTNRTCPNSGGFKSMASGLTYLVGGNGSTIHRSTDGSTWTSSTISVGSAGSTSYCNPQVLAPSSIAFDGTRFLISGAANGSSSSYNQFAYTTDLINFTFRQLAFPTAAATSGVALALPIGTGLCILPSFTNATTSTVASYCANWFSSSEYVGQGAVISSALGLLTPSKTLVGYVKVKG